MNQKKMLKRQPCAAALDMVVLNLEGAAALLEAVQIAVESGDLPRDMCADALVHLNCSLHETLKALRAETYEEREG